MTRTDTEALPLPEKLLPDLLAAEHGIQQKPITVNVAWWHTAVPPCDQIMGPVCHNAPVPNKVKISRDRLFEIARKGINDEASALCFLWHCLAWGTGERPRRCLQRIAAATADGDPRPARILLDAIQTVNTGHLEAYKMLYPGQGRYTIPYLGCAFFTKVLYFAGAGTAEHRALILDDRVVDSLRCMGWRSLQYGGFWPADTYDRYIQLLTRWANLASKPCKRKVRPDEIEIWLFDKGRPSQRRRFCP